MKKKLMSVLLAGTMVLSLVACGKTTADTTTSDSTDATATQTDATQTDADATQSADASGSKDAIRLVNGKPEINGQLNTLAAKYKEETGNEVVIETIGGDQKASDALKGYYQAGNMPDIFFVESNDIPDWEGKLVDLAGEQWTEDTDSELVVNGVTVGFPYSVEATALGYNKELLDKAGIDPSTLTSPAAWKEAVEKLDSMKDELGITAVFGWCTEPSNLGWSSGTHVFGQYLDAGLAYDDTKYIDLLNDGGQIDENRMKDFAEFIDMMNQYSDPDLVIDGNYDSQVAGFAEGKYVFVTQGNWIAPNILANDNYSGFEMGFAPYAFEDGIDTIIGGVPNFWAVYADGNVEAAKAFLQWCSEDSAQQILVEEAALISPYTDCKYTSDAPFAASIAQYISAGKLSYWHTMEKKSGLEDKTSVVFNQFAQGALDVDSFVSTMGQVISSYYAK